MQQSGENRNIEQIPACVLAERFFRFPLLRGRPVWMTSKPVLYLTGGGTGGHLFPGIALARSWLERHPESEVIFVGSERSGELRILSQNGCAHISLAAESSATLRRNPVRFAWRNSRALIQARNLLRKRNCLGIVGMGGFASAPLLIAARWLGLPYLTLEQNAIPGRANRGLSKSAQVVCCAFEEAVPLFPSGTKCLVTGTPVRTEIAALNSIDRVDPEQRRLLVLGGSLGAVAVNTLMIGAAERLPVLRGWQIVHQTGEQDHARVQEAYRGMNQPATVIPFIDQIASEYSHASCAVARAGGVTLSELSCAGVPALLVPLPTAADNHQLANASHYQTRGGAIVVKQQTQVEAGCENFSAELQRLLAEETRVAMRSKMLASARPQATERVIAEMERYFL